MNSLSAEENYTGGVSAGPEDFTPEILYEDNHLLFVNKPAGMLTQADASGRMSLLEHLKSYIKTRDNKPGNVYLGMVQRLDKPVSGLLVFAKTSKGAGRISEQIRERRLSKCYLAVTAAGPDDNPSRDGEAEDWRLVSHRLSRVKDLSFVDDDISKGQTATLKLKTLLVNGGLGFHAVRLITGRKHQIRAQLAALARPICGDHKYGSAVKSRSGRILLHSYRIRLLHPTKKTSLEVLCPPPVELFASFSAGEREVILAALKKLWVS